MSPERSNTLWERYSALFPKRVHFSHDDGWFNVVDETLAKLDLLRRATGGEIAIHQIKEKMASLRIYFGFDLPESIQGPDRDLWWAISRDIESKAYGDSTQTCEVTGEWGQCCVKIGGWLKTLSPAKAKEMGFVPWDQKGEWQKLIAAAHELSANKVTKEGA